MSFRRLVALLSFLAIFAMAARVSVDTDTWWHLRAGQWIIENRAIPRVDYFSYTRAGQTWLYPGWLVEVPMYLIYDKFGPGGLNVWTASIVCLTFILIWYAMVGGVFLRAFVLILAATASGVYWSARPQLVTLLFAATYILILEGFRWRGDRNTLTRLWLLPVIMIIWVNSHGGFIIGFLIWGIYLIDAIYRWKTGVLTASNLRIYSLVGSLMIIGACINPAGASMLGYPFKTVQIHALQGYIQEWQSPNFHEISVQPYAWLILVTFGFVGASRRRIALTDFLLCSCFIYLGLLAGRNIALFSLSAPLAISRHSELLIDTLKKFTHPVSDTNSQRKSVIDWCILFACVLLVLYKVYNIYPTTQNQQVFSKMLPVGAIEYINKTHPPGRLFNSYNWGGFLDYNLPDYPVFVDGRTDLYDDLIINEWITVIQAADGWQEILDKWQINLVLVEPDRPIVNLLDIYGWKLIYKNEVADLYQRPDN